MPLPGWLELTIGLIAIVAAFAFFVWSAVQVERPRRKPKQR